MLVQLVHIQVLPGKRQAFLDAFRLNWEGSLREPGNIRFDVLCDPEDENSFSIYEVFQDEAALEAHRATEHYRRCVELIAPLSDGPRSKRFYQPVMVERPVRESV
ncbi:MULTISPECIES: antibiotic biosynthesis monooxygenase [Paracoccus]|jgi:autoinducer 2-degrading protein|uniref:Autoinducer-2 (AI-2) modifying protein LsrG n=1 Tax=Paracoccus litorisediminis TaxID=2006130 RepID=A0A844HL87_9RHOB|nr:MULTISPECIES: antibiotic biosynthesis monooxygenase [Paracoccus]MBD9526081.1 antibiotic biosynthesis monooxygenase [Paracoccus sp. PAR01]MTH58531.1 autoinducer-2 (AI-2) modifying protein LsrG [Paracoccus litorisediminis]